MLIKKARGESYHQRRLLRIFAARNKRKLYAALENHAELIKLTELLTVWLHSMPEMEIMETGDRVVVARC